MSRIHRRDVIWDLHVGLAGIQSMEGTRTRLTTAPEGFEYYRICDREGVCQVVRGMWAAQHLTEDMRELSANKTKYSEDWV